MSTSTFQRTYSGHEGNRQTDFNQTDLISLSLTIDVSKLTRTNQWLLTNFSQVFQPIRSQLNWPLLFNGPGFSFANSCYKQINGVAMGTKMGLSYANFFVGYIEHQFFKSVGFCRGSRVEGNISRVEGRGSRVEGKKNSFFVRSISRLSHITD